MLIELPKDDSTGPDIPGKLKLRVSRMPYDDHYSIFLPTGSEEYVPIDKAERILLMYGVKEPDKILMHVWNFYSALIYVHDPANATKELDLGKPPPDLPAMGMASSVVQKRNGGLPRH